jgi:L-threonylcarbamoyladenylate synthase
MDFSLNFAKYVMAPETILKKASEGLLKGELVVFPTETVYGLGANAFDARAVEKIYELKGRPRSNPLIIHIASTSCLPFVISIRSTIIENRLRHLEALWPGPLTVVLPKNPLIGDEASAGLSTIGVRIPSHPLALHFLSLCKIPVAAPSANRSTEVSPTAIEHAIEAFGDKIKYYLDGGPCALGLESTIVSLLSEKPTLLRYGMIPLEQLEDTLHEKVLRPERKRKTSQPPITDPAVPGSQGMHYAPRTPLLFRRDEHLVKDKARLGLIAFTGVESLTLPYSEVRVLSPSNSLHEVARELFAVLRELDKCCLDAIVVDECPEEGIGCTIMDRLRRATIGFHHW